MGIPTDLPIILFESAQTWADWLESNHANSPGIWLQITKKGKGVTSVSYTEAVEVALCYGWIDGQKNSYDEQFFLQRFTPRRSKSNWSKINVEKATQLIASGKMQPAGLKEVEAAQRDGRWEAAYAPSSQAVIPEDFLAELEKSPQARLVFDQLNQANRYAIYFRIQTAQKPETRQARIQKMVAMLAEGKKLFP